MEEHKCKEYIYFCRHYVPWHNGTYAAVECGHCIYARTKSRKPEKKACEHFVKAENSEGERA